MDKLDESIKRICEFRDERDWKQFHTPKDLTLGMIVEAGEIAEHFLWKNTEEQLTPTPEEHEKIGNELADVFHYVLLLAERLNINLSEASKRKIEINKKVPSRKMQRQKG